MTTELVNLYSTRAHVFQVNPETKNTWLTKGDSAIPVSFVSRELPTGRRELRLIGTSDDNETVLDCVIQPSSEFTKRSQKFGQWIDHTGTTHGLGFISEVELDEFISMFRKLQQDLLSPLSVSNHASGPPNQQPQISQTSMLSSNQSAERPIGSWRPPLNSSSETNGRDVNSTGGNWRPPLNSSSDTSGRDVNSSSARIGTRVPTGADLGIQSASNVAQPGSYPNTLAHPGQQLARRSGQQVPLKNNSTSSEHDTNNNSHSTNGQNNVSRYPRSQSMVGMQRPPQSVSPEEIMPNTSNDWVIRDQLKYENERLKQALEESSKNAGIWQNELMNLRTNNSKLTQALQESKAHVGEWEKELFKLRDENKDLKLRVMALESANDPEKTEQYKSELAKYKTYIDEVQEELRKKEDEIEDLQQSMEKMTIKTQSATNGRATEDPTLVEVAISTYQKQRFDAINSRLDAKINELQNIQKEYTQLADKLYH